MSATLYVDKRPASAPSDTLPLVMLHGWGMNLRVFDLLRNALPERESWAIDLPGCGRSDWWPEASRFEVQCEAVLQSLPERCVLVGWSFGGKIAMALAATHPGRICALGLLATTPRFARSDDWPQGSDPMAAAALHNLLDVSWQSTLSDFVWLQVRGSRDAETTGRTLESALLSHGAPHREALHAGLDLLGSIDLRSVVSRITQPTLLVAGASDRVTLPAASQWLAQQLPHATLVQIPRAGHAPFVSHYAEVAVALRDFLDTLPPST